MAIPGKSTTRCWSRPSNDARSRMPERKNGNFLAEGGNGEGENIQIGDGYSAMRDGVARRTSAGESGRSAANARSIDGAAFADANTNAQGGWASAIASAPDTENCRTPDSYANSTSNRGPRSPDAPDGFEERLGLLSDARNLQWHHHHQWGRSGHIHMDQFR
jgi:hypothetical protein